ncbi:MAG: Ig-like domain repeat protein, partial [Elusimicrobia bacterium]|nr:Ig-like domain repeat protein [Elusimicrobiota bacterium]
MRARARARIITGRLAKLLAPACLVGLLSLVPAKPAWSAATVPANLVPVDVSTGSMRWNWTPNLLTVWATALTSSTPTTFNMTASTGTSASALNSNTTTYGNTTVGGVRNYNMQTGYGHWPSDVPTGPLSADTTYWFKVKVSSEAEGTGWSAAASTITKPANANIHPASGTWGGVGAQPTTVSTGSFTVYWGSGTAPGGNSTGTCYELQLSTYADFSVTNSTTPCFSWYNSWGAGYQGVKFATSSVAAPLGQWTSNTTWYAQIRTIGKAKEITGWTSLGSTMTKPSMPTGPQPGVSTFTFISTGSFLVNWSSGSFYAGYNSSMTAYLVQIASSPIFYGTGISVSSITASTWSAASVWHSTSTLAPNTTYYVRIWTRGGMGISSGTSNSYLGNWFPNMTNLGSTMTLATPPDAVAPSKSTFTAVNPNGQSFTVNWTSGQVTQGTMGYFGYNRAGTRYEVRMSTDPYFTGTGDFSVFTTNVASAAVGGLTPDTVYYSSVCAVNGQGTRTEWFYLGQQQTPVGPSVVPGYDLGAGTLKHSGSRNIIYHPSYGYWSFFSPDNTNWKYKFSADGVGWGAANSVFPVTYPLTSGPYGSVYYVAKDSAVFVVTNDGKDFASGSGRMYYRRGVLALDGTITWGAEGVQNDALSSTGNGCGTGNNLCTPLGPYPSFGESQARGADVFVLGSSIAFVVNAKRGTSNRGGNWIGLNAVDTITFTGGAMFNNSLNTANGNTPLDPINVVGVTDAGTPYFIVFGITDSNPNPPLVTNRFAMQSNTLVADNLTPAVSSANFYGLASVQGTEYATDSIAHVAYVASDCTIKYQRRTAATTWQAAANIASGDASTGNPFVCYSHPTITYVDNSGAPEFGADQIYVIFRTTAGHISAVAFSTGATAAMNCETGVECSYYRNIIESGDYPKSDRWVRAPNRLSFLYEDQGKVYYAWMQISANRNPNLAGVIVSSEPATAPFTHQKYDIVLTSVPGGGYGPSYLSISAVNYAQALVLKGGLAQDEIHVDSTTWIDEDNIRFTVTIGSGISGGPYDIMVMNPDGRYDILSNALTIPKPAVVTLSDPGPSAFVVPPESSDGYISGSAYPNNSATANFYRNIYIGGKGFMNWGTSTVGLSILDSGDLPVSGINSILVGSLTSGETFSEFFAKLKISTTASPGGPYKIRITNPDGQYSTVVSTFYVTVATAAVLYPLTGNTTGFPTVKGGMWFNPQVPSFPSAHAYADGTSKFQSRPYLSAQIKIRRVNDGYYWRPSDDQFRPSTEFTDEDKFFTLTSSNPWTYTLTAACKADGEYEIIARGRTSDQPRQDNNDPTEVGGGPESTSILVLRDNQAPLVSVVKPVQGSGANDANAYPLKFQADDGRGAGGTGTGVQKMWFMIMSTGPSVTSSDPDFSKYQYISTGPFWTASAPDSWVAWCRKGFTPNCECKAGDAVGDWCWDDNDASRGQRHWISTGPYGSPAMEWTGKFLFRSLNISSDTTLGQDVYMPPWVDGKEYYIVAVATDALAMVDHGAGPELGNGVGTSETSMPTGSWLDAYPNAYTGYRFIYDISIPTVTGHASVAGLSEASGSPTLVSAMTVASGTISDNVAAVASPRHVFMRIRDTVTGKYLNPNTLIKFDVTGAGSAWSEIFGTWDEWSFDTSLAQFVDGTAYKLELYAEDGASNKAVDDCPYDAGDEVGGPFYPMKCRTGSSSSPKYVRYFKRDKVAPTVVIKTPAVTLTANKLGGALAQVTGTAADQGVGVSSVQYTLRFNASDPTMHWEMYTSTAGRWLPNSVGDTWNIACDAVLGCDRPAATWATWISSNIAFLDGQDYVMVVRSVDGAGNASEEKSLTFTLDRSSPTSAVTTAAGAYTSRVNTISGTVADEVSTGVPSGLDPFNFYVGIKRLQKPWEAADFYWTGSTWTAATGAVYESSVNVLVAGGIGVKTWNLTLPSTFYDLCRDTETFVIFSSARDTINYPGHEKNVESSATVKMVFSYRSSTSTVTNMVPVPNSASNAALAVSFDVAPEEGGRTSNVWFVAVDTDGYYWTGSTWSGSPPATGNKYPGTLGLGLGDPLPLAVDISTPWLPGDVWLTTAAHSVRPPAWGPGDPDMAFEPGTTPDGLSTISLAFNANTTIVKPAWDNGRKYRTYVRTRNTAFQHYDTGPQDFIYDIHSPTITAHYFLANLSSDTALATAMSDISYASGTITDNVSDDDDLRQIYVRVQDRVTLKYLNINTLTAFDTVSGNNAWILIEQKVDEWAIDLSNAKFVAGNTYMIEVYAKDQAGNSHVTADCPWDIEKTGPCHTGNAANPKFRRYFRVDRVAPFVQIVAPVVTVPNNIGKHSFLAQITGISSDVGFGVGKVEYTLAFDQGDPTYHWKHHVSSGEWKAGYVGDIWNQACDSVKGCGIAGGDFATWLSSNIAWIDSQNYLFQVRSVDVAGNESTIRYMLFNLDASTPTSVVTTAGGAYTSRVNTIAGTLVDQVSSGVVSGLDSNGFRVAVQRLSDNKWWCDTTQGCSAGAQPGWIAETGAVYEASHTIIVGASGGAWSLPLSSTFYDLLGGSDTFKVFTWAKDKANNPADSLNQESSTTHKMVFSVKTTTPTLTSINPAGQSAKNSQDDVTIVLNPEGGRIKQAWVVIMDTNSYWWAGSSWSATATTDPPPTVRGQPTQWEQGQIWLSTEAALGGSPDLTYVPNTSPDGTSSLTINFDQDTKISTPPWVNGSRYKIYVRARNAAEPADMELNTSLNITTHVWIYDVTAPTVTAHNAVVSMSTSNKTGEYSWAASMAVASGTIKDNVSDNLDYRQIYIRIIEEDSAKYLNPNTLIKFDWADGDSAWSRQDTIADNWDFDLSQSQFSSGFKYRMEIYASDGAGNQHASARNEGAGTGCPVLNNSETGCQTGSWTPALDRVKFKRYFLYDKTKPTLAVTTPTVTNPNYIGGTYDLVTLSGTAADPNMNGEIAKVEFSLALNKSDPTHHWEHYETSGAWKLNTIGDIWNKAYPQGSVAAPWSVWTSSNITWFDSDTYILKVRAVDKAGNVSNLGDDQTRQFIYDKFTPKSKITNLVNMQLYTYQVLSIDGTAIDDSATSTGTASGLAGLGMAITRESDGFHWNGSTWAAPATSSMTVSIGQGVGLKTWSLALDTTFYDLLQVQRDTFTVYCWATDMTANPGPPDHGPNMESNTEIKVKYVFESGPPQVAVYWPPAASGQNNLSSTTLNINAIGSGIQQAWVTFISSDGAYYWTASSWSATPVTDPDISPDAYSLWLTTDDANNGGPDMVFKPAFSQSNLRVNFGYSTHTILMPAWVDGRKYRIFVKAKNTANQETSSYPGSYAFIYDITKPTVTLSAVLSAISSDPGNRGWSREIKKIDGDMLDNTADGMNIYSVFIKLFSVEKGKCLDYNQSPPTFSLDCPGPADGWKEQQVTGSNAQRAWEWDITGADFIGGNTYNLEVWGRDLSRNSTGTALSPVFKKYFKYDSDKPGLVVSTPIASGRYGSNGIDRIMGYASDVTAVNGLGSVEYRLEFPEVNKWEVMSSSYGVWRSQLGEIWNVAATTTTDPYETWQSSNIAWVNGEEYTLYVRAKDPAGNYSDYSTSTFRYDAAVPISTPTKPVNLKSYSQQIGVISGTALDMPDNSGRQAGVETLMVGVRRQSDWKWWNGAVKGWDDVRDDWVMVPPVGWDQKTAWNWTHSSLGGFWTGIPTAETLEVYAWSRDKVDKPDTSYRNIESSNTVETAFRYEVQGPTSTIIWPTNGMWVSDVPGYRILESTGRAVDKPLTGPGSGGAVQMMQIQIRRGNNEGQCWNGVAAFNGDCLQDTTWHNMTYVVQDTWTFTTYPDILNATLDGDSYRVRMRAKDDARDGTESWTPNVESDFEANRNEKTFRVDKTKPFTLIQIPNAPNIGQPGIISGTASDANSGAHQVHVAYQAGSGAQSGCWWVVGTVNTWDDCGSSDPPEKHFVEASTQTAVPVPWEVTGGSIPAMTNNTQYRLFARATDKVGNVQSFPGVGACTTPPSQSSCIVIFKTGAEPQSFLTSPTDLAHYKPSVLSLIEGTLSDATTAQVRLINVTAEPDEVWQGGSVWVDTDTYPGLLGCGEQNFVVNDSTCGFHGVGNMIWQRGFSDWPAGTNQIKVQVRAVNGVTVESPPFDERTIVLDSDPPTASVTLPSKVGYRYGELVQLAGFASDASPGDFDLTKAKFQIIRATDNYRWNGQVFYDSAAVLTANYPGSGVFNWTQDKLVDQSMFVDGARYKVRFQIEDRAGNAATSPDKEFRLDATTPTATLDVPGNKFFIQTMGLSSGTVTFGQTWDADPYPADAGGETEASGLESVEVSLVQQTGPGAYSPQWYRTYPSTGFLAGSELWHPAQIWASSWTYTNPGFLAEVHDTGRWFRILVRARDKAGNTQESFTDVVSSRTYVVDKTSPTLAVTAPAADGVIYRPATLSQLTGTAREEPDGRAIAEFKASAVLSDDIDIQLYHLSGNDTYYWNGSAWLFNPGENTTFVGRQRELSAGTTIWRLAGAELPVDDPVGPFSANSWQIRGDQTYRVRARGRDDARTVGGQDDRNLSDWTPYRTFVMDVTLPVSSMTWPVSDLFANDITSITGTANAALSGLDKMEIRITTDPTTGPWWDGKDRAWSFVTQWSSATIAASWDFTGLSSPGQQAFTDHQKYYIYTRATDLAGNVESPISQFAIIYDTTPPNGTLHKPENYPSPPYYSNNGGSVRPITLTSGTISDIAPLQSGQTDLWVAISSGDAENVWWTTAPAAGFSVNQANIYWSTNVWLAGTDWSYTPPWTLSDGVAYRVHVRTRDKAGNWKNNAAAPGDSLAGYNQQFRYDISYPTSTVLLPENSTKTASVAAFSGQANDPGAGVSGIKIVYAAVQHTDGSQAAPVGQWWNWGTPGFSIADPPAFPGSGWTWVASTTVQGLAAVNWSTPAPVNMMQSSNTYRVAVRSMDWASNPQQNPLQAGAGSFFRYDTGVPAATVTAPGLGSFVRLSGNLAGTANDELAGVSGLARVQVLLKLEANQRYWTGTYTGVYDTDWDGNVATKFGQWIDVTAPLKNWTKLRPPMPGPVLDSRRYRLWVYAADEAGNAIEKPDSTELTNNKLADGASDAWWFIFDSSAPFTRSTSPAVYMRSDITSVAGTAWEAYKDFEPSGLQQVKIRLARSGPNATWYSVAGLAWQADEPAFTTDRWNNGLPAWQFNNLDPTDFEDGYQYRVNTMGTDLAGNDEVQYTTYTFIVDRSTPASRMTFPTNNGYVTGQLNVQGTANDRYCYVGEGTPLTEACVTAGRDYESGINPSSVTVMLKQITGNAGGQACGDIGVDNDCWWDWNGSWQTSAVPLWSSAAFVGDSSGTWTYLLPADALTSPNTYKIASRSRDRLGGYETELATYTFVYDTTKPVALATGPAGYLNGFTAIAGTARDDTPGVLNVVELLIKEYDCSDVSCHINSYWNGYAWGTAGQEHWLSSGTITTFVSGTTWAWVMPSSLIAWDNKSTYTVTVRARDMANNREDLHLFIDTTFYLETPGATLTVAQPPFSAVLPHYSAAKSPADLAALSASGSGSNLKVAKGGVRLKFERLTSPASWWFNDPPEDWRNDFSTYTEVSPNDASSWGPYSWYDGIDPGSIPDMYNLGNASYTLTATPVNNANQAGPPVSRTFVIDNVKPAGLFEAPVANTCPGYDGCINSLATVSGTTKDPGQVDPPSIAAADVKFRLKRLDNANYWDGAAFTLPGGDPPEFPITAGNFANLGPAPDPIFRWSTATLAGPALLDGIAYRLMFRAKDKAGNAQGDATTGLEAEMDKFSFLFDTSPPVGILTQPPTGYVYKSLTPIAGTAQDPAGQWGALKSDLVQVQLEVREQQFGTCWRSDGAGAGDFGSCVGAYFNVSGLAPWTTSHPHLDGKLATGDSYVITARAVDRASNPQISFGVPVSSRTIYVDKQAPDANFIHPVTAGQPKSYTFTDLTGASALSGTAADPQKTLYKDNDGLNDVQVVFWLMGNALNINLPGQTSYYYTGSPNPNFLPTEIFLSSETAGEAANWKDVTEGTDTWKVLVTPGNVPKTWITDMPYRAKVRARDRASLANGTIDGNRSAPGDAAIVNFIVDDTPPVSKVTKPPQTGFIQNLDAIAGTSDSSLAQNDTYYLRVWYEAGADNYFWHGTGWVQNVSYDLPVKVVGTTGTVAWGYPCSPTAPADCLGPPQYGTHDPPIIGALPDGTVFKVAIQARDLANNTETPTTAQMVLDRVGPTVTLSTPMAVPYNKYGASRDMIQLKGVATDAPAGVDKAYVEIRNVSQTPNPIWNGVAWDTWISSHYVTAVNANPWTYDINATTWTANKQYKITAKAADLAGNPSGSNPERYFIYDVNFPSSTISAPDGRAYYGRGQIAALAGTAEDWVKVPASEAKSGLLKVEVLVMEAGGPPNYWQGNAWNTGVKWLVVSTTTLDPADWAYPPSNPAGDILPDWYQDLTSGKLYTIQTRATDETRNVETAVQRTFTYDHWAPTTTVSAPYEAEYLTAFTLSSGPFTEHVSIPGRAASVAVKDFMNAYWNGAAFAGWAPASSWRSAAVWEPVTASSWSWSDGGFSAYAIGGTITDPRTYTVYSRGIDGALNANRDYNVDPSVAGLGKTFRIDPFKPVSKATVPAEGAYLTGRYTPITGTADDQSSPPSGTPGSGINTVYLKAIRQDNPGSSWCWSPGWAACTPGGAGDPGFILPTTIIGGAQTVIKFQSQASLPEAAFDDGYRYKIVSQAADLLMNTETVFTTLTFIADRSTPTAAFDTPGAVSVFISTNNFSLSSGTHVETFLGGNIVSSVTAVYLQLRDVSQNSPSPGHTVPGCPGACEEWWDGDSWEINADLDAVSSATVLHYSSWTFSGLPLDASLLRAGFNPADGPDGRQYMLRVKAKDRADNQGTFPATLTSGVLLTFDGARPDAGVVSPAGAITTSLATITGTAVDPLVNQSSSGIKAVSISIMGMAANDAATANRFWNEVNGVWGALNQIVWSTANWNGTRWQFTSNAIDGTLKTNDNYVIISSATDKAGNQRFALSGAGEPGYLQIQYRLPPAVSTVTFPLNLTHYKNITAIQGTANDKSERVGLSLRRWDTNQCWNGAGGWAACPAERIVSESSPTWSYTGATSDILPNWLLVNNTTFTVTETGYNRENAAESPNTAIQFYIDMSSPMSTIAFPYDVSYVSYPPTMNGLTNDRQALYGSAASGIKDPNGVWVRLKRNDNGQEWNQTQGGWLGGAQPSSAAYAAGNWSFVPNNSAAAWAAGRNYSLGVYAEDKAKPASNVEDMVTGANVTFTYDPSTPTVSLQNPDAGRERNIATVLGQAGDEPAGAGVLKRVLLRVQLKTGVENFANPSNNWAFELGDGDLAWSTATFAVDWTNWYLSSPALVNALVSGSTYSYQARALDMANNYSMDYATKAFVYDVVPPTTSVLYPVNGSTIAALYSLSGTLQDRTDLDADPSDDKNPGKVAKLRLRIKRLSDNCYWNGGDWSVCGSPVDIDTDPEGMQVWSTSWTIKPGNLPAMTPNASYYLVTQGEDDTLDAGVGNTESWSNPRGSTFTFDNGLPVSWVNNPLPNSYYSSFLIANGGSFDGTGVSTVSLNIQNASKAGPNNCYRPLPDNDFNGACPNWFKAKGQPSTWDFTFPAGTWQHDKAYVAYSSATDFAGNVQTALSSAAFTFDDWESTASVTSGNAYGPVSPVMVGASTDAPAGIANGGSLEIAFSSNSGTGAWWNGTDYTGGAPLYVSTDLAGGYVTGAQADTWQRTLSGLAMTDGQSYLARIRTRDRASPTNERVDTDQDAGFMWDLTKPTATITAPAAGSSQKGNFSFTGSSNDPDPDGGGPRGATAVSTVTLQISKLGTNDCYRQASNDFGSANCPAFFPAFGVPAGWNWTPPAVPWGDGQQYLVLAAGKDYAQNQQIQFTAGLSSAIFTYDQTGSTIGILNPADASRKYSIFPSTGRAGDTLPGRVALVQVRLRMITPSVNYANPANNLLFELDPLTQLEQAWFTADHNGNWDDWKISSGAYSTGQSYAVEAR